MQGGLFHEDINKWITSLSNVATWSVTRTVRVVPLIDLFDADLRAQIVAATLTCEATPTTSHSHRPLDAGVFISPIRSGRQVETSQVTFNTSFPTPPRVLIGLYALDFDRKTMVRIKGNVPVVTPNRAMLEIITWDSTTQISSRLSWLAVSTLHEDIQCGTFETLEDRPADSPQTKYTRRIQFEHPYDAPPKVVVWLHHIAVDSADHHLRIKATTSNMARDGFDLHVETWDDSKLWSAGVSWLAHSASRTDIASGTYSTSDIRPPKDPQKTTSGHVSFDKGTSFRHAPTVFVALSALSMSKECNTRLSSLATRNVTNTGMDWSISTWDNSILYFADASFVAF